MTVERRVIMLSRGGRLGTFAVQALGDGRSLSCFESPADLADWTRPPVEVVLLDIPRRHRGIVYRQLRQRYRGPVLALLDPDDDGGGLPPDRGPLAILHRPFSGEELSAILGELLAPALAGSNGHKVAPAANGNGHAANGSAPARARDAAPAALQVLVSDAAAGTAPAVRRARRLSWEALSRRGLRRWEVAVGAAALVLLGLSFGAPSGCGPSCAAAAGTAIDGGAPVTAGALAPPAGAVALAPQPGPGGSAASATAASSLPGVPPTTSAMGALISSLSSSGGAAPPLLATPVGGPTVSSASAGPLPPTTRRTTTTRRPTTTRPPATRPPTTKPPPPTTAPPPPTTVLPPPPTTVPPPPPTTVPLPPTTELLPPVTTLAI